MYATPKKLRHHEVVITSVDVVRRPPSVLCYPFLAEASVESRLCNRKPVFEPWSYHAFSRKASCCAFFSRSFRNLLAVSLLPLALFLISSRIAKVWKNVPFSLIHANCPLLPNDPDESFGEPKRKSQSAQMSQAQQSDSQRAACDALVKATSTCWCRKEPKARLHLRGTRS